MVLVQLTYFCGSAPQCMQVGNEEALKRAKFNLDRHYSVVGIASDLELSLRFVGKKCTLHKGTEVLFL